MEVKPKGKRAKTARGKAVRRGGQRAAVKARTTASSSRRGKPKSKGLAPDRRAAALVQELKAENARLRESREKYRNIVERIPAVVYLDLADDLGSNFYISPQVEQMLGYPLSVFAEKPAFWHKILVPDDYEHAAASIQNVLKNGRDVVEYRVTAKDGRVVWIRDTCVLIRDEAGKPKYVQGFMEDITPYKQAQEELKTSQERLRLFFNQSLDGFFFSMLDEPMEWNESTDKEAVVEYVLRHQRLTEANDAMINQYGASRETFIGRTASDFFAHDLEQARRFRRRLFDEGRLHLETEERRDDGSPIWIEGDYVRVNDEQGRIIGMFGIQRDITDRKNSERALRESEERYRTLVTGMLDGVYRSTHEGRFVDVNPAMVRMFGYDSREEMLALDIKKDLYFSPEDRESLFLDTGQEKVDEFRMKRKDGSEIWVEDHGRYIHDAEGNVVFHEGILRDITERKHNEQRIQAQLEQLNALHIIENAINSNSDLRTTLEVILREVAAQLKADAAAVLLFNKDTHTLDYTAGRGFRSNAIQHTKLGAGEGYAGRILLDRKIIHVPDLAKTENNRLADALDLAGESFAAYVGSPLIAKGQVVGVLEIFQRAPLTPDPNWFDFLALLADQAALAIDNAQLFENLQRTNFDLTLAYDATIEGWSRAMDLRDRETEGHTQRVTNLTIKLARELGIPDSEILHIRRGALLHDIGKMGVPDSILHKPDKLTLEEWEIMRQHTNYAFQMLSPIAYLKPALDIPRFHHEKWDGSGYPDGLAGEQIPIAARIFAVVDVWDALTTDRSYRPALTKEDAIEYIRSQAGKHFDPQIVEVFLSMIS